MYICPGDPRRPYPTDYEMRGGWLAGLPTSVPTVQAQGSYGEPLASNRSSAVTGTNIKLAPTFYK